MSKRLSLRSFALLLCVCLIGFLSDCAPKKEPADLVLANGKLVTMDEARPQAEALAVRGWIIVAVGSEKDIKPFIGEDTKIIDLGGRLAIPGFMDAHVHFTGIGQAKLALDLRNVKNWDEILALIREAVSEARPVEWIQGRGWHQEKWDKAPEPSVDGLPFHHELSRLSPENPVLLTHASGHSSFANARAMELAGITKNTPDPPGGEIVKDAQGNPIGVFRETAQGLLRAARNEYLDNRPEEENQAENRRVPAQSDPLDAGDPLHLGRAIP
ncbi:MAG: amidohydrolase family protein, partial [Candidatus Deferrimicrobiaceae bacterium]